VKSLTKVAQIKFFSTHPCKHEDALYLPIQIPQRKKGGRREFLCDTLEKKPVGRIKSWVEVEKPNIKYMESITRIPGWLSFFPDKTAKAIMCEILFDIDHWSARPSRSLYVHGVCYNRHR
jgi:hypothetical protein